MKLTRVARLDELRPGRALRRMLGERPVALLQVGQEVYAVDDCCTHEDASLSEGYLEGYVIECPRHGAAFDVRTGRVLALPATRDLPTYPVRVEDGAVWVGVEATDEVDHD